MRTLSNKAKEGYVEKINTKNTFLVLLILPYWDFGPLERKVNEFSFQLRYKRFSLLFKIRITIDNT